MRSHRPLIALLLVAALGCGPAQELKVDPGEDSGNDGGPPGAVATPVITFAGSAVTIRCATSGASLYYTLDGTDPSNRSPIYAGPVFVTLDASILVVKAFATRSDLGDSAIAQHAVLTVSPTFSESFDVDPGWEVTQDGTGNVWQWASAGHYRIDYSSPTLTEDSRLMMPTLYLPSVGATYYLVFNEIWHGGYSGFWSSGDVEASLDGGTSWERVIRLHEDHGQGTYTLAQQVVLDVSAYRGRTVRFAFRYQGVYDWDWTIDDVQVYGF